MNPQPVIQPGVIVQSDGFIQKKCISVTYFTPISGSPGFDIRYAVFETREQAAEFVKGLK
jgi:hypothetical protein